MALILSGDGRSNYPHPNVGEVLGTPMGTKQVGPLTNINVNSLVPQTSTNFPGLGLESLRQSHHIFSKMGVTSGPSYGMASGTNLSYNHTLLTCKVSNPEFAALTVGDLLIIRKHVSDVDSILHIDSNSRSRAPPDSRVLYNGTEKYLVDSNRYFVLTPAGFNAYMAAMTDQQLTDPNTNEEFTVEQVWSRWAIYGVITALGPSSASYLGPERATQPQTLSGSEKALTITYEGEATMRNYFSTSLMANQKLWAIFRRAHFVDVDTVYKASPNLDLSYTPPSNSTRKPFVLSFYSDPSGYDYPPPRSVSQYEDMNGVMRDGLIFPLGHVRYPFLLEKGHYNPTNVLTTYESGTLRVNLRLRQEVI